MASMKDVAERAKVAKSTVSLVLNNSGYVAEETRKRVEQAMKELNYRPNQLARNLSLKRSNLIGIILPDMSHPFYGTVVKYLEEALYQYGYKTMICQTIERENMEQEFIGMLKSQAMDGIIMASHSLSQKYYQDLAFPVVGFDRYLGAHIPVVRADHAEGGRLAAEKMYGAGVRKPVQIGGAAVVSTPAHQYHESFRMEMRKRDVVVRDIEMKHNAFSENDFAEAASRVFEEFPDADGIFGADLAVSACLREAVKRKKSVPGEIRLLAYDGTYVTRMGEHNFSAVVQPFKALADACVRKMNALILNQKEDSQETILPVSFQEGDTL